MSRLSRPSARAVTMLIALLVAGCTASEPTRTALDPHAVLVGQWGWTGTGDCAEAPISIRFSDHGRRMHLSHEPRSESGPREPRRDTNYTILRRTPEGLHMAMDGESRLDASGNPVTWDLVLLHNDRYCWHRNDWKAGSCTDFVDRCGT